MICVFKGLVTLFGCVMIVVLIAYIINSSFPPYLDPQDPKVREQRLENRRAWLTACDSMSEFEKRVHVEYCK